MRIRIPIDVSKKEYQYFKKRKDMMMMTWRQYFFHADSLVKIKKRGIYARRK